jgi:hypothetical protein
VLPTLGWWRFPVKETSWHRGMEPWRLISHRLMSYPCRRGPIATLFRLFGIRGVLDAGLRCRIGMQLVRRRMLTLRVVSPDQSTRFNPDESTSNPPLWFPRDSKQFDRCHKGSVWTQGRRTRRTCSCFRLLPASVSKPNALRPVITRVGVSMVFPLCIPIRRPGSGEIPYLCK